MSDEFISGLRSDLVEAAAREAARGRVGRAARPLRPRVWNRRVALGAAALAAAAAAFVAVVLALASPRPAETARPRIVATIATGTVPVCASFAAGRLWIADFNHQLVAVDVAGRRVARRVGIGLNPTALAAAQGEIWVRVESQTQKTPDHVLRIDSATGRTTARITVGRGPGLAADERWVWAPLTFSSSPTAGVDRIDRARGVVAGRLDLPGVAGVVSADGLLWAPTRDAAMVEIDAATGRILKRFPGIAPNVGSAMVAADRGLWLLTTQGAQIVRFAGQRIVDRVPVDPDALPLLARTSGGLWTVTGSPGSVGGKPTRLVRIDPDTHRVTATIGLGPQAVATIIGAGRDLLVVTEIGRVIVVRG